MDGRWTILKHIYQFKPCNSFIWFKTGRMIKNNSDTKKLFIFIFIYYIYIFIFILQYSQILWKFIFHIPSIHAALRPTRKTVASWLPPLHPHPPKNNALEFLRVFFSLQKQCNEELFLFFYFFFKILERHVVWLEDLFELSNDFDALYSTHLLVMIHIIKHVLLVKYPVTSH